MSMDLYLWKEPVTDDPDEAARLLEIGDESVFEASADVVTFFDEVMERFPPPESFADEALADAAAPWADTPEASDRLVWLSIRWSADDAHLDEIVDLARKHDLVLYDPQGPSFHSPEIEQPAVPVHASAGEHLRGVLLTAFGLVVAVGGWKLSIPVLSWVLVLAGGFVALVSGLLTVAVAYETLRSRRVD